MDESHGQGRAFEGMDMGLWGKSEGLPPDVRYPLICHLLDVGAVAEALWRDHIAVGLRQTIADGLETTVEHAGKLIPYWASLHDIGKLTYGFQSQDAAAPIRRYPSSESRRAHGQVAGEWLQYVLPEYGYAAEGARAPAPMVSQLLGGHHGSFHRHADTVHAQPLKSLGYEEDTWEEQRRLHLAALTELFGSPTPPARFDGAVAALVCGLVIQADWLASQLSFVGRQLASGAPAIDADLPEFLGRARDRAPDLLQQAGLGRPAPGTASFARAFPHIENPNGLQRSLAEHLPRLCNGPGMLLVAAPTGEGKTEAALYAAEVMGKASGRSGLYVALPTMATADQMYSRVDHYLNRRVTASSSTSSPSSSMTLLHGMAWMNPDYSSSAAPSSGKQGSSHTQGATESRRAVEVSEWLQGRKRGLFADFAVGTVDQALMAALRSRHNTVRLLGLSGKTVVIDEVHAADAYMLALVTRLLNWLGRLRVPVILLSATLHHSTARVLTEAYLKGAGRKRGSGGPVPEVRYPGWVYAGAEAPHSAILNPEPLETTPRRPLTVQCREVPLVGEEAVHLDPAIRGELADLVEAGGCAAVIRTTVAEAQHTFSDLAQWSARRAREIGVDPPEIHLLHARFPADQREHITRQVVRRFGADAAREGERPRAAILVATAIIEQSIDIDLDVMISDLAPVHLLLQRAGRCWRHEHRAVVGRPRWADAPRLVVLAPAEANVEKALPRAWRYIHHPSLLLRTHNLIRRREGQPVRVPEDVQELVDGMIDDAELNPELPDQDVGRRAEDMAHRQLGDNAAIPRPNGVTRNLHPLTDHDLDEAQVATRFGADSARVVCCYADPDGARRLDTGSSVALPAEGELPGGRFTEDQVRAVLSRSLPVPGAWLDGHQEQTAPPEAWQTNPHLRHVQLLVHRIDREGTVQGPQLGKRRLHLDERVGLIAEG